MILSFKGFINEVCHSSIGLLVNLEKVGFYFSSISRKYSFQDLEDCDQKGLFELTLDEQSNSLFKWVWDNVIFLGTQVVDFEYYIVNFCDRSLIVSLEPKALISQLSITERTIAYLPLTHPL